MKKTLLIVLALLAAGLATLGITFTAETLPVGAAPAIVTPEARPPAGMTLSTVMAGKMFSPAAFAYRGGSFAEERVFGMGGILVQHPQGALLFDAGFGKNVDTHFKTTPILMQLTSRYAKEPTVAQRLQAAGLDPKSLKGVVLTHAHWDHVSGIEDLPGVPVWVTAAEQDYIRSGPELMALMRSFSGVSYQVYDFPQGPYLGYERSFDVFSDGSVVLVPAPGHTPGSIIAFVTLPSGARYALVGDLVWQTEGVELPAQRPFLARDQVDWDAEQVRAGIVHVHQLQKAIPGLIVVPAHDRRAWEKLPQLSGG